MNPEILLAIGTETHRSPLTEKLADLPPLTALRNLQMTQDAVTGQHSLRRSQIFFNGLERRLKETPNKYQEL